MTARNRIDVHHHTLPQFYKDAQIKHGITGSSYAAFPEWTAENSLGLMDKLDIAGSILSFTSPGIWYGDPAETRDLARKCNEFLAEQAADHPQRFGGFAILPLPDNDACLNEIAYVYDELGLDGITLLTSVNGRYVGHPDFEVVYAELDRREAVVHIHPCYPPGTVATDWDIPGMLIDYPFETTRVAVNLIFQGVVERYPNIRFILSHAGGTLPFLTHHLAAFEKLMPQRDNYPNGTTAAIAKFWFDTAANGHAQPLQALTEVADPARILFGTDYPYVNAEIVAKETAGLDAWDGFTSDQRAAVDRTNAQALFPRFA